MDEIEQATKAGGVDDTESAVETRRHRRSVWLGIGVVSLLLLLLATPPLMNVNRLRRRIAASMSASLGRPVHLDNVSLHLLPVPGFTLENLVVSEDAEFGAEPVIRANQVEVTLRPSSLWRRQVELSSIKFVDPSVNLVRNHAGRWNLESLLMHAAQVESAPTDQRTPGPTPRFPYIEASGGRVNLKLGDEKEPFALIDTDFALWQPTPEEWRVRLEGKPARTDTNTSDTGTVTLEGQLKRSSAMGDVPVDLRASWRNAPLGEASKVVMGTDAGWRGTLLLDATLAGALRDATLTTHLHLNDLRRADFVPVKLLNINVECSGTLDLPKSLVAEPSCVLPMDADAERRAGSGAVQPSQISAVADTLDLSKLQEAEHGFSGLQVGSTQVPDSWLMDWARLFSQRLPANESPKGTAAGSMRLVRQDGASPGWQGEFHAEVDPATTSKAGEAETLPTLLSVTAAGSTLTLAPVNVPVAAMGIGTKGSLTLAAEATPQQYMLHLSGAATSAELQKLRALAPPLGDGLDAVLPSAMAEDGKPLRLNVMCTRVWGGAQSCTAGAAEPAKPAHRVR